MVNKFVLDILTHISGADNITQRQLAQALSLSPAYINKLMQTMRERGLISSDKRSVGITEAGRAEMEKYRVGNAVILAAGLGSRFVPLVYDRPKGLIEVRGERMVERQIRQLNDAGIDDITICVGYLKEQFEYLIDKYDGVKLLVVRDYTQRNNLSTLNQASSLLGNTYVISSDHYMENNPFTAYDCQNWYGNVVLDGNSAEWYVKADSRGKVKGINIGGKGGRIMMGPAHFTQEFSDLFRPMLADAASDGRYDKSHWEQLLLDNISRLPEFYAKPMFGIYKLSTLEGLRQFDPSYRDRSSDKAMGIISQVFDVNEAGITEIKPMKEGMTNTSFLFCVDDKRFIFRNPGVGSNELINRQQEYDCYQAIKGKGIADEPIYMDRETGVKITTYFEGSRHLDPANMDEMKQAMGMLRRLHSDEFSVGHEFNHVEMLHRYERLMAAKSIRPLYTDYAEIRERCLKLFDDIMATNPPRCMCHNDPIHENFLVLRDGSMRLIDWEYSGMADPVNDIAMHCLFNYYGMGKSTEILELYLGRRPDDYELMRLYGWIGLAGFIWAQWTIYKEGLGDNFGDYGLINYRLSKKFTRAANAMLDKLAGKEGWQQELAAARQMSGINKQQVYLKESAATSGE